MLQAGDRAPSFTLDDVEGGEPCADPWADGPVVLAFFKVSCPVCQQAGPVIQAMADQGARVVAVGEDPPAQLRDYAPRYGQRVPTLSEPPPYPVSTAFGIDTVPSLFLVGGDGVIVDAVVSWDREAFNRLAAAAGVGPVSHEGDGRPAFRPG